MSRPPSLSHILESLSVRNIIDLDEIESIHTWVNQEYHKKDPVFITVLYGTGAWIASFFFLFFIFTIIDFNDISIYLGIALYALSIFMTHRLSGIFWNQLGTAFAITGNFIILFWAGETLDIHHPAGLVPVQAAVCVLTYPFCKSGIYRFIAPLVLVILMVMYIFEEENMNLIHGLILAETLLFGSLLFIKRTPAALTPLFYAMSVALPATLIFFHLINMDVFTSGYHEPMRVSSIILSVSFTSMLLIMGGGFKTLKKPWMLVAAPATIILGLFTTPGILIALSLLVSGFYYGYRSLVILSFIFLPGFLFIYYYSLNLDLAYKSLILAGSGILLLTARTGLNIIRNHEAKS